LLIEDLSKLIDHVKKEIKKRFPVDNSFFREVQELRIGMEEYFMTQTWLNNNNHHFTHSDQNIKRM